MLAVESTRKTMRAATREPESLGLAPNLCLEILSKSYFYLLVFFFFFHDIACKTRREKRERGKEGGEKSITP